MDAPLENYEHQITCKIKSGLKCNPILYFSYNMYKNSAHRINSLSILNNNRHPHFNRIHLLYNCISNHVYVFTCILNDARMLKHKLSLHAKHRSSS